MKLPREIGPIHFVGIGGIGMSGIAEVLNNLGYTVQGSDASEGANVARLRDKGIMISIGHKAENVAGADVVVVSTAIKRDNPELMAARAQRIPVVRRAEMLAELMRLKSCVAISGTHGKTTTTSMVAALLDAGDLDPTVINGGIINAYGTNARLGAGDWMVVEADESDGTFLKLPTDVAIVTNVDPEHLDHFKTFEAVQDAFRNFVENVPFYGFAVMCIDHPVVQTLVGKIEDRRIITYGENPQADARLVDLTPMGGGSKFNVVFRNRKTDATHELSDLMLPMPGRHNALNATAAIAVAHELAISDEAIRKAIGDFGGVKRRFTRIGEWNGVTIIDDYGHHPVEISAVLKAAREFDQRQDRRCGAAASLHAAAIAVRGILHLLQRRRCRRCGGSVSGRRGADTRHRPRSFRARPARARPSRSHSVAECRRARKGRSRHRRPWRSGRLSRRGQHHAVGLRAAGRTEGAGVDVAFPDITPDLKAAMPQLRGRLLANQSLAELTWFRVGGPAQILFTPADEDDLAYFLKCLPKELPVYVVGVGSNLIVRDGGMPGAVIRLSPRAFGETSADGDIVSAGTAALDKRVAETAAGANIAGMEFFFGIPGTIGGALRMNAGANGSETRDVLVEATGIDRDGTKHAFTNADMKFVYRNSGVDPAIIFTSARFRGRIAAPETIRARMDEVQTHRETAQPIREKTGGSTFKNPPGNSAWKLIDAAGCRGLRVGGAQVSEMHCNFLINTGSATGHDIETLGETVRARVKENSGIELHWEIKRIGIEPA